MNRVDFLSSLPFVTSCDSVPSTPRDGEATPSLRSYSLSLDAYPTTAARTVTTTEAAVSTPERPAKEPSTPPTATIFFGTSDHYADAALTAVSVTLLQDKGGLFLTVLPDTVSDDKNHPRDQNNFYDDETCFQYYQIKQPPQRVELTPDTETKPACLVLYFDVCAWRLFALNRQSNAREKSSSDASHALRSFQQGLESWHQSHRLRSSAPLLAQSASSSTMSPSTSSPPAAQTTLPPGTATTSPHAKRARVTATASRDTRTHLQNLRALLRQPKANFSDAQASLQQFGGLDACCVQDETQRRALQHDMQTLSADALCLQQAMRQAIEAYFPVTQKRRGKRKVATVVTTAATTAATADSPSPSAIAKQVQTLLQQHEAVVREKHALAISAMARKM